MKNTKRIFYKYRHFYSLLIFIPLLLWFKYCEDNIVPRYIMHSPLDDRIPFIKQFVIPYIVWYFYIAFGLVYVGIHSKQDYYKLLLFLAGGMAICYIIYMIFPNAQDLRPEITQKDTFSIIIKYLYEIDTPTNVCPSIHVLNSVAVDAALRNCSNFSSKKRAKEISFIIMISICISTLFIKQHSIIDFINGFILAVVFYIPIYAVPNIKKAIAQYN